jgi:hypothetical protein
MKKKSCILATSLCVVLVLSIAIFAHYSDTPASNKIAEEEVSSEEMNAGYRYNEARADYIFEEFGMVPEQYTFARDYELLNYVESNEYLAIRTAMNIQVGTTTPSFFIDNDTIFGVCQDVDAVNRMYEFSRAEDGTCSLRNTQQLQDAGRYQDIYQSFSEYQAMSVKE